MTAPAPSPAPAKRSKKVLVLWAIALTLLVTGGLFSWLVVVPVMQVRSALPGRYSIGEGRLSRGQCEPVIEALGGEAAAARKLRLFLSVPYRDAGERELVVRILGRCGPPSVEPALSLLQDKDANVRRIVVWGLGDNGGRKAMSRLQPLLKDDDPAIRHAASQSLDQIERRLACESASKR